MTGKYWGGERGVRSAKDLEAVALYVTLSVKTKLKSFFYDLLFSTKNHPLYGKQRSVKM